MSVKAEAEAFRRIPLFTGCEPSHLQMIAFSAERVEFPTGAFLIRQGEKGAAAFLMLQGRAEASIEQDGETRRLALLEPGSFVGELAMIADLPYSLTAVALENIHAVRIPRTLFMRVASEFPEFAAKVHAALSSKLNLSVSELRKVQALFENPAPASR
jgi:CRP-like cAMP-binding protein